MKNSSNYFLAVPPVTCAALSLLALSTVVHAVDIHWDGNGATPGNIATPTGNWGTSAFWSPDATGSSAAVSTWNAADTAVFSAGTEATGAYTVTVNANTAAAGLKFEEGNVTFLSASSAKSLTVNSNLELTLGSRLVTVGSTTATTTVNLLLGSNTLTLNSGNLDLYGSNTMSAATLKAGNITIGNANAFGTTGSVTLGDTAASSAVRFRMRTLALARPFVLQSGTGFTLNATLDSVGFNSPTITGGVTSSGTGTTNLALESVISGTGSSLTFTASGTNPINHTGALSLRNGGQGTGTGNPTGTVSVTAPIGANVTNVTITDATSVSVSGTKGLQRVVLGSTSNAYTGNTAVSSNSRLELSASEVIPDGSGKGNLAVNGNLILTTGTGNTTETVNGLSGSGSITRSGATGTSTLIVGANDATSSFTGMIGNGAGKVALTKIGSGTLTLNNINTYTGSTTIAAGTLSLELDQVLADTGSINIATGATLNLTETSTPEVISVLRFDGVQQATGKWGRTGSIAALNADFESDRITGDGLLDVTNITADLYWDGTGTSWQAPAAWSVSPLDAAFNPTTPPDLNNLTRFGSDGLTLDQTVNLNGDQVTPAMVFTSPVLFTFLGGNADHTLTLGGLTVDVASEGPVFGSATAGQKVDLILSGSQTWTNASLSGATIAENGVELGAGTLTLAGAGSTSLKGIVSGSGAVTKTATGSLDLLGANTYTGSTSIQAGTAMLGTATSLGGTANGTVVGGGATLDFNGQTVGAENITLGVGSAGNLVNSDTANPASLAGDINLNFNSNAGGAGDLTLSGVISQTAGAKNLTKTGAGKLTITNANLYTGTTTLANGSGTVAITNPTALGSGPVALTKGGTNTGTLELSNGISVANAMTFASANGYGGGGSAHIRNVSGNNTLTGTLTLTATGGNGMNVESNGGLLTLTNTITSTITDNTRQLGLSGTGNGLITGNIVNTGSNQFAVIKSGTGIWTLSGSNTYTGATNVGAGTLVLTNNGGIADTASVNVSSGAFLQLDFAGSDTIAALVLGGVAMGPGTYTASHPSGRITGTGALFIPGADPFASWIATPAFGLAPADRDKTDDPDNDGLTNEQEFALDGNPASGAATGKVVGKIDSGHLTLTLPVRTGATFNGSGPLTSLPINGVVYRIDGDDDLSGFTSGVEEVAALTAGMPGLTTGWTYRTFRLTATTAAAPKGFLRADVSTAPAP
ncbi:autotransporter-associated beta strand repeat-containing protein [Luteolibacter arcticus]|uniref:Autotransporter-associated beta strand repeat-containing protein n=1 Tax=Luteolibacter arcticus TaxID=1581411 RepID=A0ABT3GC38_9BACT|nr:autotransporter-associated beta strand repeat-containing protein [Luteolibacter arcticus]MCW1921197.1 autotransporter-associated beta strand repeat-containing protein [Luteolibacter arcticus]